MKYVQTCQTIVTTLLETQQKHVKLHFGNHLQAISPLRNSPKKITTLRALFLVQVRRCCQVVQGDGFIQRLGDSVHLFDEMTTRVLHILESKFKADLCMYKAKVSVGYIWLVGMIQNPSYETIHFFTLRLKRYLLLKFGII